MALDASFLADLRAATKGGWTAGDARVRAAAFRSARETESQR